MPPTFAFFKDKTCWLVSFKRLNLTNHILTEETEINLTYSQKKRKKKFCFSFARKDYFYFYPPQPCGLPQPAAIYMTTTLVSSVSLLLDQTIIPVHSILLSHTLFVVFQRGIALSRLLPSHTFSFKLKLNFRRKRMSGQEKDRSTFCFSASYLLGASWNS